MTKTLHQAEKEAHQIVDRWAVTATGAAWIPFAACVTLSAAEITMISQVADIFGVTDYAVEQIFALIGANIAGHLAVDTLLSFIPGPGWAAKAVIAAVVVKIVGETVITFFKEKSPYV
jgi:uncharacterized protein (DUF697 family)